MRDRDRIILKFNPDTMTVSDLKKAATTLRGLLIDHDLDPKDWEKIGCQVSQIRGAYTIE